MHTDWVLVLGVGSFAVLTGAFAQQERDHARRGDRRRRGRRARARRSAGSRPSSGTCAATPTACTRSSSAPPASSASTARSCIAPAEAALRLLSVMAVLLAVALLVNHV